MFHFFLPASKVQKDRRIMRETDSRMAKYSRRGLVFNFCAFLVCLAGGRFVEDNKDLMVVLTTGLLLITILRGFYLFRFDQLYPRAPAKWRNQYFVATLIGAIWWGVILASVTIQLEMSDEAPLLWLYTVIFFSTTAHAFAPYQKFLSYYQFFGQVPAAAAAVYVGGLDGYIYGLLMVVFYLVLTHQCRLISENYWERLEATYALARKTQSMEEEKRDTKANVKLNQEFLRHLHLDLEESLQNIKMAETKDVADFKVYAQRQLGTVFENICDFNGVLSKDLVLDDKIFNIRHEIQHLVAEFVDDAEAQDVQIETSLSPTLPMRLKGDAARLAQVIRTLLSIILKDAEKSVVLVEVEFLREYESAGELYVSIGRATTKSKKRFFVDDEQANPEATLSLVVAKGLADMMDGSIEVADGDAEEQLFRFNAKIDVAELRGQLDFHKNTFSGNNVLLINSSPRILDLKRQELDALGFEVFTETKLKRALQTLQNSYKFQKPIKSLIYYIEPGKDAAQDFTRSLAELPEMKYTNKIVAATRKQQQYMRGEGFDESQSFFYVDKPLGLFEFESIFYAVFNKTSDELTDREGESGSNLSIALYSQCEEHEAKVPSAIHRVGFEFTSQTDADGLVAQLGRDKPEIILLDCDNADNIANVVRAVRDFEIANKVEAYTPIIGLSTCEEAIEHYAYELGLDDYVDLTHNAKKSLKATINYWSTLI